MTRRELRTGSVNNLGRMDYQHIECDMTGANSAGCSQSSTLPLVSDSQKAHGNAAAHHSVM